MSKESINPNLHIYIEGTDLTGKDSVGERISEKTGIQKVQKLVIVPENPYHLQLAGLPEWTLLFSPRVARAIIYDIRNADFSKDFIQISSHAMRAVSFERAAEMPLADVFDELVKYAPVFDCSFLLTASLDAKKHRLAGRPDKSSWLDERVKYDPDFVYKMDTYMLYYASDIYNAIVIDTSRLTIEDVAKEVESLINDTTHHSKTPNGLRLTNAFKLEQFLKVEDKVVKEIELFEKYVLKKRPI